jgi:hypothetical protein
MPSRVVERDSNKNLEIDKGIRNCWKWEWMETRSDRPSEKWILEDWQDVRCATKNK